MSDGNRRRRLADRFDTATAALILKFNRYPVHHGALGIIRSLGRVGVPVDCLHDSWLSPAALSRYQRRRLFWQPAGEGVERLLARLADLGGALGRGTVLIPTDDAGAIFVDEHADTLAEWFRFPRQPPGLPRQVASKRGLHELCARLGIPSPRVWVPGSRQQAEEVDHAAFPVVAKWVQPWSIPSSSQVVSTTIVHSRAELADLYRRLGAGSGGRVLLQEFIPAATGQLQDWFFHGYCDAASRCLVSFTGTKLRSSPPHAGMTTLGRSVDNPALRAAAEQLLRTIGYRGVVDLDFRLDVRDGEFKLLDFNPRVGAQFRLFEDEEGIDVVRALHLDMTGRPVTRRRQIDGRVFVVENEDVLTSVRYWRQGQLTARQWVSSLRGASRERAWLAADDPAPAMLMWLRFALLTVRFPVKALWRRLVRPPALGRPPARVIAPDTSPRRRTGG